jgi:hypothetical protein
MEFTISWEGEPEDVTVTTSGDASVEDLDAMTRAVLADERYREGLGILIDHSETRWSRLTAQDARRRVQLLERQAKQIGRQRVAFVVSGAADFGVGRMLTLLVEGRADIESRIFYSAEEARSWLREPYGAESL